MSGPIPHGRVMWHVSVENITCWCQSWFTVLCSTSTILNFAKCPLNIFAAMLKIIHHHVTRPSDHHAHPTHTTSIQMVPAAKIRWKASDRPLCRQMCQHDGLLRYVEVRSRCASCLDNAVELAWVADCHPCGIMWEADVPPAGVCTAEAPSLAILDQGWWVIQYRTRYVSILALWHLFLVQVHCGYWGISLRA